MSFFGGGLLLGPDEGKTSSALGLTFTLKALSRDTSGAYLAFEFELPPGAGLPPHIHLNMEEAILVVSGELTNRVGDEVAKTPAGSFCMVPRGTVECVQHDDVNAAARVGGIGVPRSPGCRDRSEPSLPANTKSPRAQTGRSWPESVLDAAGD